GCRNRAVRLELRRRRGGLAVERPVCGRQAQRELNRCSGQGVRACAHRGFCRSLSCRAPGLLLQNKPSRSKEFVTNTLRYLCTRVLGQPHEGRPGTETSSMPPWQAFIAVNAVTGPATCRRPGKGRGRACGNGGFS